MRENKHKKKTKEERIAKHDKWMKKRDKDWKPGGVFLGEGKKEKKSNGH